MELYINNQLVDWCLNEKRVLLRKVFLNPAELSTKESVKSYNIVLPTTGQNNRVFNFRNVQEARGKFDTIFDAYLIAGGVKIFEGKFKFKIISVHEYTGILYTQNKKSIADIFGEKKMSEGPEWLIDFDDFKQSVEKYNRMERPPAMFPLALYGLLPKISSNNGYYSNKNVFDDTVELTQDDFPPFVNCIEMMKNLFAKSGLKLTGTALTDKRIADLYVSYKNPTDYEMPWNYGNLGTVEISGQWSNYRNLNNDNDPNNIQIEKTMVKNLNPKSNRTKGIYVTDLLSTIHGTVTELDNKGNLMKSYDAEKDGIAFKTRQIEIPYTGLYKINLQANFSLVDKGNNKRSGYYENNKQVISSRLSGVSTPSTLETIKGGRYEIKVVRNVQGNDLLNCDIDRDFYLDNINQDADFTDPAKFPKYFPDTGLTCFIDPVQNKNILCGLSFGGNYDNYNPYAEYLPEDEYTYSNVIALKGGYSYDGTDDEKYKSAVLSRGYIECYLDDNGNTAYRKSDKYKVDLQNSPVNSSEGKRDLSGGNGYASQIVHLEKGDKLTVISCSDEIYNTYGGYSNVWGAIAQDINYTLRVEAYQPDELTDSWLTDKLNSDGGTKEGEFLDWNDPSLLTKTNLNLTKFLPTDIKINDWITNFCNAFNLRLVQKSHTEFNLNIPKVLAANTSSIIELDSKAHIRKITNTSLELPAEYRIGFTVNEEENGFVESGENGGGVYRTKSPELNVIEQKSNFSFAWYKELKDGNGNKFADVINISNDEVWEDTTRDYGDMMLKDYTDYAQRFCYKGDLKELNVFNGNEKITAVTTKNGIDGVIELNYHDKPFSIMRNFFTLLTNARNCYTTIQCVLSPADFARLPYSLIRFNGDIYFAAEIDSYDPLQRYLCNLKMIRLMH